MKHKCFLLLTRNISVEKVSSRGSRLYGEGPQSITQRNTPCVLLLFLLPFQYMYVLPLLPVRNRLCVSCVTPKFHKFPSRGNIIMLRWYLGASKDRATLYIQSRHGKVYKRALVVPPSSPHQRAFVCGACTGTEQVGVSLVSLCDPLFKRSRLHCLDVCLTWYLWHIKVWWQNLHR